MSKYNEYAQRLDVAFKTAREEYMEAWNQLQAAQKAERDAQAWRAETYRGENDLRRQRAKAELLEAEHTFKATESRVWAEFDRQKEAIRRELESDVRASSTVDPDAIDANALELLKSGILTADDIFSMVNKYDSNLTMLRLISKTAKELADDKQHTDAKTRGLLYTLCGYTPFWGIVRQQQQQRQICRPLGLNKKALWKSWTLLSVHGQPMAIQFPLMASQRVSTKQSERDR